MKQPVTTLLCLGITALSLGCSAAGGKSEPKKSDGGGQESPTPEADGKDGDKGDDEVVVAVPMGLFADGQQSLFLTKSALLDQAGDTSKIPDLPVFQAYQIMTKLADSTLDSARNSRATMLAFNTAMNALFGKDTELGNQVVSMKRGESRDVPLKTAVELDSGDVASVTFSLSDGAAEPEFTIAAKNADGRVLTTATVTSEKGASFLSKATLVGRYTVFFGQKIETYAELDFTQDFRMVFGPSKPGPMTFRQSLIRLRIDGDLLHLQAGSDMTYAFGEPDEFQPRFYPANADVGMAIFADAWIDTKTWDMAENVLVLDAAERKTENDFAAAMKERSGSYTIEEQHIIDHLLKPGVYDDCATLGDRTRTLWGQIDPKPEPATITALPADMCQATAEDTQNFIKSLNDICAHPLALFWHLPVKATVGPLHEYYFCLVHEITLSTQANVYIVTDKLTKRTLVLPENRTAAQKAFAQKLEPSDFYPLDELKFGYIKTVP